MKEDKFLSCLRQAHFNTLRVISVICMVLYIRHEEVKTTKEYNSEFIFTIIESWLFNRFNLGNVFLLLPGVSTPPHPPPRPNPNHNPILSV
jgi:hypothetical protein